MRSFEKETAPVVYNSAGVKILKFSVGRSGAECFRMHWHERMELLRVHEGIMQIDFGSYKKEFPAGSLAIVHPNQPHKGVICRGPARYDVLMFDIRSFYNNTDVCRELLPAVFEGKVKFRNITDNQEILNWVDCIISEAEEEETSLKMTAHIYQLLFLLYKDCVDTILNRSPFDKTVREIIEYIETNFASDLTTEQLSERFQYAKPYFCRKFKESTGLTPMTYLRIFRIEKAYSLMKEGNRNISEIALSCGFTDSNYFSRCFKAHFGHCPTYYKHLSRN